MERTSPEVLLVAIQLCHTNTERRENEPNRLTLSFFLSFFSFLFFFMFWWFEDRSFLLPWLTWQQGCTVCTEQELSYSASQSGEKERERERKRERERERERERQRERERESVCEFSHLLHIYACVHAHVCVCACVCVCMHTCMHAWMDIIGSAEALPILCVRCARWEREIQRERERERERDGSDVTLVALKLAMNFAPFLAKNFHLSIGKEFCTFPCQIFAP